VKKSADLFARAVRVTPGGVHSPVRAFKDVGGDPLFIRSGQGATLTDVDGNHYTDFSLAFGPLIFGHADPDVAQAVGEALQDGWSFGAAEARSLELAELITAQIDWVDSIRFVNSGTEAVMSAIRLARAVTGRDKILKFEGCYHGHTDAMLIRAGSGLASASSTSSAGIPAAIKTDTLVAQLDDDDVLESIFTDHGNAIAAVIIEPLPANHGLLIQRTEFLQRIADFARESGALLIFDEVISGFRVGFDGYAGRIGIHPDIVTWGKILGGGFPVGAFAAKRELMDWVAPAGPVYQAGTLSANPVAMTAGLTTLRKLLQPGVYAELEKLGQTLDTVIAETDDMAIQRVGSMFWLIPGGQAENIIRSPAAIPAVLKTRYPEVFHALLKAGVYLPPSAFEIEFLCTAHQQKDITKLGQALRV
jgi:glutamate-1-semialdehyde 2,1-aminomutase